MSRRAGGLRRRGDEATKRVATTEGRSAAARCLAVPSLALAARQSTHGRNEGARRSRHAGPCEIAEIGKFLIRSTVGPFPFRFDSYWTESGAERCCGTIASICLFRFSSSREETPSRPVRGLTATTCTLSLPTLSLHLSASLPTLFPVSLSRPPRSLSLSILSILCAYAKRSLPHNSPFLLRLSWPPSSPRPTLT